jgi:hypothetical protein
MAADYITEIRRVQPHGPYFLAGHSFGGLVSFEIAQQLVREGDRVSFLGLIDTVFRERLSFLGLIVRFFHGLPAWVRVNRKVRGVRGLGELLFRGPTNVLFVGLTCVRYIRHLILNLWFRPGRPIPHRYREPYYLWLRRWVSRNYVHKPYPGHITMFSSAGNSDRQTADWGALARGGLTVLEVPAPHHLMLAPPHCKLVAEHLDTCLDASVRGEELARLSLGPG